MKLKTHNVEQGSPEWHDIRSDKLTASNAQAIGNNGKGLETYVYRKMSEYYSNARDEYTNKHIKRGNELEPLARDIYELKTGNEVEQVGFVQSDEHVGCSPDGLIGEDGLVEIKCPNDYNHYKIIRDGEDGIKSKYLWQVQMQLMVTGRDWCDLVYYNPNFPESIVKFRIEPDEEKFKKLEKGIKSGVEKIKQHLNNYDEKENKAKEIFG